MTEPHASPPNPLQGTTAFPFPLTRLSLDTQLGRDPLPQTPVISTHRDHTCSRALSTRDPETRVTLLHHCSTGMTVTAATTVGQPSVPGTMSMVPLQSPASGHHGVKKMAPELGSHPTRLQTQALYMPTRRREMPQTSGIPTALEWALSRNPSGSPSSFDCHLMLQ